MAALTGVPADLFLRDDDLGGERVLGVGDWVVQQTDAAHHLSRLPAHTRTRFRERQERRRTAALE